MWTDSLTAELNEIYKQGLINGYGVAIINQNGTIYQNGFGYADVKNKKKYTDNTLQNIASISKTLLGVALFKAQELGKLNLDDTVNKYLPFRVNNPHYPNEAITIRHLATHTSTIYDTDFYDEKSYILKDKRDSSIMKPSLGSEEFNHPDSIMPMSDFLQNFLSKKGPWYLEEGFLNKKPGELYEYSNVGATLAAYILELATGETYAGFTQKHILSPLKMSSSGWSFESVNFDMHSKLYVNPQTELPYYSLITYPDGGLITSVNDMGNFLCELIKGYSGEGELLTKDSYKELFKEQLTSANFEDRDTDRPYDDEYNSGIFMGYSPIGYIGHTGGDPGVSTFMFFNPETKIGRILFINTGLDNEGAKQYFAIWDKLEEYVNR
jgi:CubicO group peptidase (beta-lactamase class C family)